MVVKVLTALPVSWNCAQGSAWTNSSNPCSSSKVAMNILPILQMRKQRRKELEKAAEPELGVLVPKPIR